MSLRDLAEKYGRGNSRALVNRAVRAELVGGDHALDAQGLLDQLAYKFRERDWAADLADAGIAQAAVARIVARLRGEIRARYQIGGRP